MADAVKTGTKRKEPSTAELNAAKKKAKEEAEHENEERSRRRWQRSYTSENSTVDETTTCVLYCAHCSAFASILDTQLTNLAQRKTDQARVLDETKHTSKHQMVPGQTKLIQRAKGVEKQFRLNCKDCDLPLAYKSAPLDQSSQYLYLLSEALTTDPATVAKKVAAHRLEAAAAAAGYSED